MNQKDAMLKLVREGVPSADTKATELAEAMTEAAIEYLNRQAALAVGAEEGMAMVETSQVFTGTVMGMGGVLTALTRFDSETIRIKKIDIFEKMCVDLFELLRKHKPHQSWEK